MKIGIIGTNGKAGTLIAAEAYQRGHDVTAILRDAEKMPGIPYHVLEKDIFDLGAKDLRDFDAVVSAFGLPFGGDHPDDAYQQAYDHLIDVFEKLPKVRLLVVGGAASLYQDESRTMKVIEMFPESMRKDPADMAKAYKSLKKSNVNYTYFSPACFFDPRGRKTKKYKVSDDVVIHNQSGESYISYADYAYAMVDEIERGNYIRRRFTAVSDSRSIVKEEPYYGIRPERPAFEGMSQYCEPFNFELAGQTLRLVLDNGKKYVASFLDGHSLRWGEEGAAGAVEYYDCAKGAEDVYFVNFELVNGKPRTNLTLIVDTAERLVTMVKTITGYHKKFPYMTDSTYFFGAIDVPGFELPTRRHKFTTDLLGKRIHWHYAPGVEIVHVYYATDYMRVAMPEGKGWGNTDPVEWDEMIRREPYDEPAAFIKIKHGLYVVSCMEKNMACRGWTGNSLLFLIDTVRVHDVGRSFGHAGMETGKVHTENYLFGAFGEFVYSDGVLESQPNRYKAKQVY
ncbi:MAG: NAD(P)H-binding protein [Eubacteriales bacterium]|nr:NAD(P)H-binding protein [Eubacteriales bacterium]